MLTHCYHLETTVTVFCNVSYKYGSSTLKDGAFSKDNTLDCQHHQVNSLEASVAATPHKHSFGAAYRKSYKLTHSSKVLIYAQQDSQKRTTFGKQTDLC